ncbi:DNA-binding protein [Agromyces badenianii]|uniref:DNA-binding protein n=1 Tax=Agromyces badenianii TaxID=2080742 RepID=A0A2S0WWZ1_9MICO|nr:helix-turn-helix domain-containing protein [Agromyces badenianii]AWB95867.1 DNA-binding protein [Agromyces badenianii]PWC03843.1 DNA-binding protein [Agromyces badenianii]
MTSPGSGDEIGRFLTLADAAEILAVDVATVDELIRSGELPAIRVGSAGPWRIERVQLEVWIELQYEETRKQSAWNQGEYANIVELSGARSGRLRSID